MGVGAVLHVGQPSLTILGVGELLFGKTSPAGRMVQTVYPSTYQDEVSIFDFNMRPGPSAFPRPDCPAPYHNCKLGTNPGRTHRFYTGKAVVPYGFGLSYSTFKYEATANVNGPVSLSPVRESLEKAASNGKHFPSTQMLKETKPLVNYNI